MINWAPLGRVVLAASVVLLAGCPYCPDNGDPPFPEDRRVVLHDPSPDQNLWAERCLDGDEAARGRFCGLLDEEVPPPAPTDALPPAGRVSMSGMPLAKVVWPGQDGSLMTAPDTPTAFVHAFHSDLTGWFSGQGSRAEIWRRFEATSPAEMKLVYPSGARLSGAAFLDSIRDRFGTSPGFEASVSEVEELVVAPDHAVVAYVETQAAAQNSAAENRRAALAVLERREGHWCWRFIQETALPGDGEG